MILLKKVRLINWYGFANITAPIGFFTLIAGKNGNGKSVLLDAIKYAAYGDTVFNKSSESKGSRTLSSYTRGLLDATAGTYMRPADKVPNVYSHIALEYFDEVERKPFVLGTVIETNAANNYQTFRYVLDKKTLADIEHTYTEQGVVLPCTALMLSQRYGVKRLNKEEGIPRFMQMTGLKLNMSQMPTYLRKLRGIMSYNPDAKIDRFIRESVLEERNVDFGKLIEARGYIERLNDTFHMIEDEIEELDGILAAYDMCEREKNRLLTDDIKIAYAAANTLKKEIEDLRRKQEAAEGERQSLQDTLSVLDTQLKELENRLIEAKVNLSQLDSAKMIAQEEQRLTALQAEETEQLSKFRELEHFQQCVAQIVAQFQQASRAIEQKDVLLSLCSSSYRGNEKGQAVAALKRNVDHWYDEQVEELVKLRQDLDEINGKISSEEAIIEACRKHRAAYGLIPDYVGLRDDINNEFEKRGISERAQFACEYVVALTDETWRDAIEAFLGPRRYTILVPPKYYDIADDVLNRSRHRYAHLFNTKLLMRKKIDVEDDSAVNMLEIKNPVAQQYFNYQLGRMRAVAMQDVRKYEYAMSKEGRVSVAMDGYFLRFDKIRFYYLGQQTFELNRRRAEREISRLRDEKKELLREKEEIERRKQALDGYKGMFAAYDYEAQQKYQQAATRRKESARQLEELRRAQQNNDEYVALSQLVFRLTDEQEAAKDMQREKMLRETELKAIALSCKERLAQKETALQEAEQRLAQYEETHHDAVQKAVAAYEKFLQNGEKGAGGLLAKETRDRVKRGIEQYQNDLIGRQSSYNLRGGGGSPLPVGADGRDVYAARRDTIWMDDLQEIRKKLDEQTKRYEDIFKNEFVLSILKYCERAQADLKEINGELAKLDFSAKYQFDVHFVKDGSDYAKILEYAKYLDERESLGTSDGQMTFDMFTEISDDEGEALEQELKKIINRIIAKNSEELIARFADYRNYMTYEILITNQVLNRAKLSRQTGFNSGAEVQIPYLLILAAALLLIYNQRVNSTRLVFIDEPFAKMDPGNVKVMLDFMREQRLQVIFCSPDKTESIGNECEVILPVLRVRADSMQLGIVQFHEEKRHGAV